MERKQVTVIVDKKETHNNMSPFFSSNSDLLTTSIMEIEAKTFGELAHQLTSNKYSIYGRCLRNFNMNCTMSCT